MVPCCCFSVYNVQIDFSILNRKLDLPKYIFLLHLSFIFYDSFSICFHWVQKSFPCQHLNPSTNTTFYNISVNWSPVLHAILTTLHTTFAIRIPCYLVFLFVCFVLETEFFPACSFLPLIFCFQHVFLHPVCATISQVSSYPFTVMGVINLAVLENAETFPSH